MMKCTPHEIIPDILIIQPKIFADERGHFFESFQNERYKQAGITKNFIQDNMSRSKKNTLRGLHYQLKFPQGKLVGVTAGKVFDVVVDIRRDSPTFGRWISFELSDQNCTQIYIPPGFAHGFQVLSDSADFYYKCTDYYAPSDDYGILWCDEALNIAWPLTKGDAPILSAKDKLYPRLQDVEAKSLPMASL